MKKIALLHTMKVIWESFGEKLQSELRAELPNEQFTMLNTLDEFLAMNTNIMGALHPLNLNRLFLFLKAMELEEPDLIVCTCSSMDPAIEKIRCMVSVPVVALVDALCIHTVQNYAKVAVIASVAGSAEPLKEKLLSLAADMGKKVEPTLYYCPDAMTALRKGDRDASNRIIMETAATVKKEHDVLILPQASMAHLAEEAAKVTGLTTKPAPDLCIEYVKQFFKSK